ncbi:MAG: cytochrome c peroxidase [Bacteroidia bacterium]
MKYNFFKSLILSLLMLNLASCKKYEAEELNLIGQNEPYILNYGNFPPPDIHEDNLLTKEGVKLGKMLFYEKLLSRDNSISCGSCHKQENAFSDINRFSVGVDGLIGGRQAMSVVNMAWNSNEYFWDGRATLLRHQSLMPIEDALEMDETLTNVINKLINSSLYPQQFERAFGSKEITEERISLAMEQFMNSIFSNKSKFDAYLSGNAVLSEEEERGRFLYFTEFNPSFPEASGADCQHCHGGANFENDRYMNNGLDTDAEMTDSGREAVTGNPADRGKFKVTTLRNIELTPPYMHDGRFNTLEEVIDHYDRVKLSATLDGSFQQQLPSNGLNLSSDDKAALVAFLKTLTDYELISNPEYADPF